MNGRALTLLAMAFVAACAHQPYIARIDPEVPATSAILGISGPDDMGCHHAYVAITAVDGVAFNGFGHGLPDAVELPPGHHQVVVKCLLGTQTLFELLPVESEVDIAPHTLYQPVVRAWMVAQRTAAVSRYSKSDTGSCLVDFMAKSELDENADVDVAIAAGVVQVARDNAVHSARCGSTLRAQVR